MLALAALFLMVSSIDARTIKIYVRSQDNTEVGVYAFNRACIKGAWTNHDVFGSESEQWTAKSTQQIGGHTWYLYSYDTDKLNVIGSNDCTDSYFKILFHNQDDSWSTSNASDPGWGFRNGDGVSSVANLPDEMFFVIDHNAVHNNKSKADGENEWLGVREITRAQAELTDNDNSRLLYFLMNTDGAPIATFEPVRNQNQGMHTLSGNSFAATIWADQLFKDGAKTAKFYIKGRYQVPNNNPNKPDEPYTYIDPVGNDDMVNYEYHPFDKDYDITPDGNASEYNKRDWAVYGNCNARNSGRDHYFVLTKKPGSDGNYPVSYTILLNTANFFTSRDDGNAGNQSVDDNGAILFNPAPNEREIPLRGIGVHPNKPLTDKITVNDDNPLYVISNMQNVDADYSHNFTVNPDDHSWDLTDKYKMSKVSDADLNILIKDHPQIGEKGDNVWTARVYKPGSEKLKSIFMAFVSASDRSNLESVVNNSASTDKERTTAWSKVIRPFVAEGKDAIATFGGLYRPVYVANGNQALSPGADDMFYTQCNVYVNLTRSTYYVDPISSYEITGPAVMYFDTVKKQFQEDNSGSNESHWGNGEASYWATPLAYNPEEDCWEYTGKFYQSKSYAETSTDGKDQWIDKFEEDKKQWDGDFNKTGGYYSTPASQNECENGYKSFIGFRFLTNHLYTINYREDYDRPTATTHHEGLSAYWDGTSTDKTGHEDTYYYNHVDIDPDVNTSVSSMSSADAIKNGDNANAEKVHNINFSLPTGTYTIRFYPEGDGKDNHSFYKLSKAEDPGTPIPDNHDPDDLSDTYKFLRTYSDTLSHSLASDQKCFIVTAYDHDKQTATLTSIPYIPANTGVILAYNQTEIEKLIASGRAREVADGIYNSLDGYMVLANLDKADSIDYATNSKWADLRTNISKNLLKPTTFTDAYGNVTNGGVTLEASTFTDDTETKIKYRNYNFTFYRKGGTPNFILGFYRLKNVVSGYEDYAKTSPNRAYLQLSAAVSGGETPTTDWDKDITYSKSDAQSKAQIFNTFEVDYPEWGNGDATGITEIMKPDDTTTNELTADSPVYDIAGRKVSTFGAVSNGYTKLPKGIYILNGKKIVIR